MVLFTLKLQHVLQPMADISTLLVRRMSVTGCGGNFWYLGHQWFQKPTLHYITYKRLMLALKTHVA